jgi:hypothetical protein
VVAPWILAQTFFVFSSSDPGNIGGVHYREDRPRIGMKGQSVDGEGGHT